MSATSYKPAMPNKTLSQSIIKHKNTEKLTANHHETVTERHVKTVILQQIRLAFLQLYSIVAAVQRTAQDSPPDKHFNHHASSGKNQKSARHIQSYF